MQAKPSIWKALLVALVLSLTLASCGGGNTGKTWFNLPSIKLRIQSNGTASLYGLPINAVIMDPAMIQQLTGASVQQLDLRWGYNGVHVFINGEDMPYLSWDEQSTTTLQQVIGQLPGVPNSNMIVSLLPWLRTIGWGVSLNFPAPAGATPIPNWSQETSATPDPPSDPPTIGPLNISNLTFDEQGNGYVGPVPLSALGAPVSLPPSLMTTLQAIGAEKIMLRTTTGGLVVTFNDKPFPGIAYNAAYMDALLKWLNALMQDQQTLAMANDVLPLLPGAAVTITVTFNGEPAGQADLSGLRVDINPDGSVRALGVPLGSQPMIPAATLAQLQAANVQRLDVKLTGDGLNLAANGEPLPAISWTPETLDLVTQVVGPMSGMDENQLQNVMNVVTNTPVGVSISVPPAEGTTPIDMPATVEATFAPPDLGDFAPPIIRANLVADSAGVVSQIGNLAISDLGALGIPANITLPPALLDFMKSAGAKQLALTTAPNQADIQLDGQTAITLRYDEAALRSLLSLAAPFLAGTPLEDPNIAKIVDEQVLPLAPGAEVDVTVTVE